jgi:hypothetical protein
MVVEGKFRKDAKGRLGGKPYRLDFGLDSAYVQVGKGDPVYSDYVQLPARPPFTDLIAVVDFDKHGQVIGFTIEGMLERYRTSSLKARLEIDLGVFALKTFGSAVKDKVVGYLQEYLPALLDSQGKLAVSGAYK